MIVNVTIVGGDRLISQIRGMPRAINAALYKKTLTLAIKLENLVKTGKLNGQVLNRITGALARSIHHDVSNTGTGALGRVFSSGDVKYAAIHEYGGTTSPHIILPKRASVLAFIGKGGGMVFARKVNHPGSKMPERSFLRSSLSDMSKEISLAYKKEVIETITRGIS